MKSADLKAHLEEQGYWYEENDGRFTVNSSAPWDKPSDEDRKPGSGVLGVLYVADDAVHYEWNWDAGYDEHWKFDSVGEFAEFYARLLELGIDGVAG